jgi:hypothetical protein
MEEEEEVFWKKIQHEEKNRRSESPIGVCVSGKERNKEKYKPILFINFLII